MVRAEGPTKPGTRATGSASERDDGQLPRRRFLGGSLRLRLTLPPAAGRHPIGIVSLHLLDRSRRDPWLTAPRPRELMVSVWYPALDDSRYCRAPWIPPAAGKLLLTQLIPSPVTGPPSGAAGPRISLNGVRLPVTTARHRRGPTRPPGNAPVVLYSPGYGDDRELGAGVRPG